MLLKHGADARTQDESGSTALDLASRGRRVRVARVLVKQSVDRGPTATGVELNCDNCGIIFVDFGPDAVYNTRKMMGVHA
ncbi:hypothetical protein BJV74DRAFT_967671 [Russula compacta]|nr:hypothetical protein BJV74DRAFT_967671 [Russula compacta]